MSLERGAGGKTFLQKGLPPESKLANKIKKKSNASGGQRARGPVEPHLKVFPP
jgi:hypothetical protein